MPDPKQTPTFCPECGVRMAGRDPAAHANSHWPKDVQDKDLGKDALKRRKLLLEGV